MNIEAFVRAFEDAVEGTPPGSLKPDTQFRSLENWSSLAALSVLAMIDAECETQLSGDEMKRCHSINELFTAVMAKKGK